MHRMEAGEQQQANACGEATHKQQRVDLLDR